MAHPWVVTVLLLRVRVCYLFKNFKLLVLEYLRIIRDPPQLLYLLHPLLFLLENVHGIAGHAVGDRRVGHALMDATLLLATGGGQGWLPEVLPDHLEFGRVEGSFAGELRGWLQDSGRRLLWLTHEVGVERVDLLLGEVVVFVGGLTAEGKLVLTRVIRFLLDRADGQH